MADESLVERRTGVRNLGALVGGAYFFSGDWSGPKKILSVCGPGESADWGGVEMVERGESVCQVSMGAWLVMLQAKTESRGAAGDRAAVARPGEKEWTQVQNQVVWTLPTLNPCVPRDRRVRDSVTVTDQS